MVTQRDEEMLSISRNKFMDGTYNFQRSIVIRPTSQVVNITCIATNSNNYTDEITVALVVKSKTSFHFFKLT